MKFTGQSSYISVFALLLVAVLSIDLNAQLTGGLDFNADATIDTDNDNRWEDTTGVSGFDFELDNSPAVNRVTGLTGTAGITAAYDFPGGSTGNEAGALLSIAGTGTRRSFQNAPGDWTNNENVTIEIWFKPDNLTPTPTNGQILFEDGGGTGLGFFVDNNEVRLRKAPGGLSVNSNISAISSDFIQVVGTFNRGPNPDVIELFVNGVSVGTDSGNNGGDWSGGDAAAVGTRGAANTGGIGGGQSGTESFDGQIAIFRVYRNQLLTPAQVAANFAAVTASDVYMTVNGDWDTDANWDTGIEPTSAQNAFVGGGAGAPRTVTQAGEVADTLTVGHTVAGKNPGVGRLTIDGGELTVNRVEFAQPGGTESILRVTNGGSLTVNGDVVHNGATRGHLYIDELNGLSITGNINIQSFRVGDSTAGSHTVNAGQTLITTGTLLVGRAADGDLTIMSAGNSAANMTVSDAAGAAGSTLTIDGGTLTSGETDVGDANGSDGTINILGGGTLTQTANISLGQAGNAHGEINVNNGTFNVNAGGLFIAGNDTGAGDANTTGDVTVGASGVVNVGGGNTEVGRGGTGTLTINGGDFNQTGSNFVISQGASSDGTVNINGGGTLDVTNQLNMNAGTSVLNINDGVVTVGTDLQMANNGATTSNATINIGANGTLNIGARFELGDNDDANNNQGGNALVDQDGGTVTAGTLFIAHASAPGANSSTYDISAGSLTVSGQTEVGHRDMGFFNLSGTGDVDITGGNFVVGQNNTNAVGEVNISGGTLDVTNDMNIGNRVGEVNQTAGSVTADRVRLAATSGSVTGDYNLTGDGAGVELTVNDDLNVGEVAGIGTFTQTAGQVVVNDILTIGLGANATGIYDISGGSLDVPNDALRIGENGDGTLNVSGTGQVTAAAPGSQIVLGRAGAGSSGAVNISGGLLQSNTNMTVAQAGSGLVDQTGGTVHVEENLNVGTNAGTGVYNLDGGLLTFADTAVNTQDTTGLAPSTLNIGSNGTFNFNGGVLENVTDINPSGSGAFDQDGGRFVIGVDGVDPNDANTVRAITTIAGDYDQNAGTLVVDVFGPGSHGFNGESGSGLAIDPLDPSLDSDLLHVMGDAELDGGLEVNLNGFEPIPFAFYDVLLADGAIDADDLALTGVNLFRVIDNPFGPGQLLQVAVPEPTSIAIWTLLALAAGGFAWRRRQLNMR